MHSSAKKASRVCSSVNLRVLDGPDKTNCNRIFFHCHANKDGLLSDILKIPQNPLRGTRQILAFKVVNFLPQATQYMCSHTF